MNTKVCGVCGATFEKTSKKAKYCSKPCRKVGIKRTWAQKPHKPPKPQIYNHEYVQRYVREHRGHRSAMHKQWVESHPERVKEYERRRREQNPERVRARAVIQTRVYRGQLPRASTLMCSICGEPANQYHHPFGYAPPNNIIVHPACKICHKVLHP